MTGLDGFPYLASFAAGLLTFVSPCVLPLIPVYISFITGVSVTELDKARGKALARTFVVALFFVLGFSFVFVMLGLTASYFGNLIGRYKDLLRYIGGAAVIIFGLHLTGVFRLKFLNMEMRLNPGAAGGGYAGAFLVGLAFAAGWTPCIGPILSSILILASTQDTVYKGMLLLSVYSLGFGIPFLLTAVFVNWSLGVFTAIKRYYGVIETVSGAVLLMMGLLIVTNGFHIFTRLVGRIAG